MGYWIHPVPLKLLQSGCQSKDLARLPGGTRNNSYLNPYSSSLLYLLVLARKSEAINIRSCVFLLSYLS